MHERAAALETALKTRLREIALHGDSPQPLKGTLAVAFSGGLDSRFLLHMILRAGLNARALHVNGPHIPEAEHAYAVRWANAAGVPLQIISLDPLAEPALENNPRDRCYHCKKAVFSALCDSAGPLPLCDGTNLSDHGEYRPGLRALRELAVHSPLAESGLTKADIREIGAATGLEHPDQAAQPCLLTRFAYGARLDHVALRTVDAAESAVRAVFEAFGKDTPFRVRFESASSPALHVAGPPLEGALLAALAAALSACGLPGAPIRSVTSLSGYFDREHPDREAP